jgi:hypothetical protein
MKQAQFLAKLITEAEFQAQIQARRVVPARFESLASYFGRHPWQILLLLSGLLALSREVVWL